MNCLEKIWNFDTVFPTFLTGHRYNTVTVHERDRDNFLSSFVTVYHRLPPFAIVTVTFMDGHGVVTLPSQKRWKYYIEFAYLFLKSNQSGASENVLALYP